MRSVVARAAAILAAGVAIALLPASAAHADPTVTITSPSGGFVAGVVQVGVSAVADTGATSASVHLRVGGVDLTGSNKDCPPANLPSCDVVIPWDTTGLSGSQVITAVVDQTGAAVPEAVSSDVTVTVEHVPGVSIDSPAANAGVGGPIDVAVSASTDAGDNDPPASISLTATPAGGSPAAVGTPVSCGASPCSGTIHWDPTGLDGAVTLRATVTTGNGLTASVARAVVVETATASITSPAAGDVVSGQVQVAASGTSTQPALDPLATLDLYVDGTKVDSLACATPTVSPCTQTLAWDATGAASGTHVLTVKLTTTGGLVVSSSDVSVKVTPPKATIFLTTPKNFAVVGRGTVRVTVSASTNVRALDHPTRIDLYVDGGRAQGVVCPGTASRCVVVLPWSTVRYAGQHRVTARVTTASGGTVFSARTYVWVKTGAVTRLTPMATTSSGRVVTVKGRVVSTTTRRGIGSAPVRITVVTSRGTAVVRVLTRSDGTLVYSLRAYTTTRIFTRASASWLAASSSSMVQPVRAPIVCRLSSTTVRAGATGKGVCSVSALPKGAPVSLYYILNGRTTLLASGAARGTSFPFSYRFSARGFYTLRVIIGANANYVTTRSANLGVTVR